MHNLLIILALACYPLISFAFDETLFLQGLQNEVIKRQNAQNEEINRQEQEAAEEKYRLQQRRQQYENEHRQSEVQNQQLRYKREIYTKTHLSEVEQNIRTLLNGKNLENCLVSKNIGVNVGEEYLTGPEYKKGKTRKYTGCSISFAESADHSFYINRITRKGEVIAFFAFNAYNADNNQLKSVYANCYFKNNKVNEELSTVVNTKSERYCENYLEDLEQPSYAIGDKLPDGGIVFYIADSISKCNA